MKKCKKCERTLPFDKFYTRKYGKDGKSSVCKECYRANYVRNSHSGESEDIIGEEWRPVAGYEDLYSVSNLGRICRMFTQNGNYKKRIIKPTNIKGYYRVSLSKYHSSKNYTIHRLVSIAFLPNPNRLSQVNHKNGITTDNRIENLEWCSASENTRHYYTELGGEPANKRQVFQYSKDGLFLSKFNSITEAAISVRGNVSNIHNCCAGKQKTSNGYIWKFNLSNISKTMNKIYEAAYNSCVYESSPFALSLHRTKEGAQKALDEHKASIIDEYKDLVTEEHPIDEWIEGQSWMIREHELKD